jgi:predicted TIM-barrel fold metal-dependent hydrolase
MEPGFVAPCLRKQARELRQLALARSACVSVKLLTNVGRGLMADNLFFDSNCQLGRFNHRIEGVPYSLEALLADMRTHGIGGRLVHHAMAKEHDTAVGNATLMDEIGDQEGLYPCWGVTTWVTGESPVPGQVVAALRASGVRAVRFFAYAYSVPMAEWSMGPIWSELEAHRVPLILDLCRRWAEMDPFDADAVHQLCAAHPELPVILTKHRIRFSRQVYQLLETCPNLRVELSGYWHYRAVEEVCNRFGEQRLVFGTNWPYMDSSFAVAMVMYAQVSDSTKAAVAGGTLRTLLEAVQW